MTAPSLYRRHRPRTFDDVVGQDHVVRTLRNAVDQGKVHHAYLFVGSRGTGKTSMAKILAACLDCRYGPTSTPCGECEACIAIQRATSLDVVEMDAASNNSVDDVRELRERVQTAPSAGRWRVYILDEAHMLTNAAWNALLKTLEEPPPQTVFVLATTEAHKVPATVVDRCHRFDFTRPTGEQLSRVVSRVADREGLDVSPGAVALLARHASGSFRDALGTLEQLVTYAGDAVREDDAVAVLGLGDEAQVFDAVDAMVGGDAPGILRIVQQVAGSGRDLGGYARELERHARDLLVCCVLGEVPGEVRLTPDRDARLLEQAQRTGRDQATRLLELLAEGMIQARDGADQRAMLELALVKAADPSVDPALRAVQARLARLEQQLESGGALSARPAAAPAGSRPEATPTVPAASPAQEAPAARPSTPAAQPTAPAQPAAPSRQPHDAGSVQPTAPADRRDEPPRTAPGPSDERAGGPAPSPEPPAAPSGEAAEACPDGGPIAEVASPAPPAPGLSREPGDEPAPDSAASRASSADESAPAGGGSAAPEVDELRAVWGAVLENLRGRDQLCAVALERGRPVEIVGEELTIAFPTDAAFYRGTADREERRAALRAALRDVTGSSLTVRFELRDLTTSSSAPAAAGGMPSAAPEPEVFDEQAIVSHLVTQFDAEPVDDDTEEQR